MTRTTKGTRFRLLWLLLAAVLALTACGGGGRASQETAPRPEPEPTPERIETEDLDDGDDEDDEDEDGIPEDPLPDGPVNILLLGLDDRDPGSMVGNPDTIILAHVTESREQVYLVSFTRDSWVSIPGLGEGKLNSAYPRGGTSVMEDTVSGLLGGLDIDFTVRTNMQSFIALTRWMEYFEVENQHATSVTVESTGRYVEFPAGRIRLENTDGLIYVRQRQGMPLGDLDRAERGRAALIGMMERIQEKLEEEPESFPELVSNLYDNVSVDGDFDLDDTVALAPLVEMLTAEDVTSLQAPITGFGNVQGQSVNLVDEAQTAALGEALRSATMEEYVDTYGTDYTP